MYETGTAREGRSTRKIKKEKCSYFLISHYIVMKENKNNMYLMISPFIVH